MRRLHRSFALLHELHSDMRTLLGQKKHRLMLVGFIVSSALLIIFPGLTNSLEYRISDALQDLERQVSPANSRLAILAADAETLEAIQEKWPWKLGVYQKILTRVQEFHPEKIVFCLPLPGEEAKTNEEDRHFAQSLKQMNNVDLAILEIFRSGVLLPSDIHRIPAPLFCASGLRNVSYKTTAGVPLPPPHRSDGQSPQSAMDGPQTHTPSMAFWGHTPHRGDSTFLEGVIRMNQDADGRIREFLWKSRNKAAEPEVRQMLSFSEKEGAIRMISLKDVLKPDFKEDFQGMTVFIGPTAPILHDFRNTAFGLRSGVEIVALAHDNRLRRRHVERFSSFLFRTVFFVFGILAGTFLTLNVPIAPLLASLLMSGVSAAVIGVAGLTMGWLFPLGIACISWVFSSVLLAGVSFFRNQVFFEVMCKEGREVAIIQKAISPQKEVLLPQGILCQGFCQPCEDAGGDFYDYFLQPDGSLFFFLGDVSGHGFPAGLITTMAKAVIVQLRKTAIADPAQVLFILNKVLFHILKRKRHMTAVSGVFFPEKRELALSLAAHVPCLLLSEKGELKEIATGTFPLGMVDKVGLKKILVHQVPFHPGDCLILYTDGISESQNWRGEQLQQSRFVEILKRNLPLKPSAETFQLLLENIRSFTEGYPFADDVTMLILAWPKQSL